jgi:hypothetical protein
MTLSLTERRHSNSLIPKMSIWNTYVGFVNHIWAYLIIHVKYTLAKPEYLTGRKCIVVDFDGTLVSTCGAMQNKIFESALDFLLAMDECNVDVFLISARTSVNGIYTIFDSNGYVRSTVDKLIKGIYVNSEIYRHTESHELLVSRCALFKMRQRMRLREEGYVIAFCIGDNYMDLSLKEDNNNYTLTQNIIIPDPFHGAEESGN